LNLKYSLIFLATLGLLMLALFIFYRPGPPPYTPIEPRRFHTDLYLLPFVFFDNLDNSNLDKYRAINASLEFSNDSLFLGADQKRGLLLTRTSFSNASYQAEIALAPDSNKGAGIVFLSDPNDTDRDYELILRNGKLILLKDRAEIKQWEILANLTRYAYLKVKFEGGGYSFWLDGYKIGNLDEAAYFAGVAGLVNYDQRPAEFAFFAVNREN